MAMVPNKQQQEVLSILLKWAKSDEKYIVLNGPGGVGKTFLLRLFAEQCLCPVMFLAPTHEALSQLKKAIGDGDFIYKTVHSALALTPDITKSSISFNHIKTPAIWRDVQIAVIDEASMIPQWILDILIDTGTKILFVGHKSQLPPVEEKRKTTDLCVSPVFNMKVPQLELTIPMRNSGDIWEYTVLAEKKIYDKTIVLPDQFIISASDFKEYMYSEKGKQDLLKGRIKLVAWRNVTVNEYNKRVRDVLFNKPEEKYSVGDIVILTSPTFLVKDLESLKPLHLEKLFKEKDDLKSLFTNTKGRVQNISECSIMLDIKLTVKCYKLLIQTGGYVQTIYEFKNPDDYTRVSTFFEHRAWGFKDQKDKKRAYSYRYFILSLFARLLHFYAATAHRLQGSTVEKVIVLDNDLKKNPCYVEQAKCRYVACSRAAKELKIYRGFA